MGGWGGVGGEGGGTELPYACRPRARRSTYHPPLHGTAGLEKHLFLSPETFLSLGIFADRLHPSAHGGRAREGQFSVWATMNKTRSRPGARMLRGWFAQPSQDAELLRVTARGHQGRHGRASSRCPGLTRRDLQAPGRATHSVRATEPLRARWGAAVRPCGPAGAGRHLISCHRSGASVTTRSPSSSTRPTPCTAPSSCRSCRRGS